MTFLKQRIKIARKRFKKYGSLQSSREDHHLKRKFLAKHQWQQLKVLVLKYGLGVGSCQIDATITKLHNPACLSTAEMVLILLVTGFMC